MLVSMTSSFHILDTMKQFAVLACFLIAANGFAPPMISYERPPPHLSSLTRMHAKHNRVQTIKHHVAAFALATLAWKSPVQAKGTSISKAVVPEKETSVSIKYTPIATVVVGASTAGILVGRRVFGSKSRSDNDEKEGDSESKGEDIRLDEPARLKAQEVVEKILTKIHSRHPPAKVDVTVPVPVPVIHLETLVPTDEILKSKPSPASTNYLDQLNTMEPMTSSSLPGGYLDSIKDVTADVGPIVKASDFVTTTLVLELSVAVTDEPVVVSEEPLVINETPTVVSKEPIVVSEQPMVVSEEPMVISEQPIVVTKQPMIESEARGPFMVPTDSAVETNSESPVEGATKPKLDSPEEITLKAKYAAIESVEERVYTILVDLGMAGNDKYDDDDDDE